MVNINEITASRQYTFISSFIDSASIRSTCNVVMACFSHTVLSAFSLRPKERNHILSSMFWWPKNTGAWRLYISQRGGEAQICLFGFANWRQEYKSQQTWARICKPFEEPRNRFSAWRKRFLGIDSLCLTITNSGSGLRKKTQSIDYIVIS